LKLCVRRRLDRGTRAAFTNKLHSQAHAKDESRTENEMTGGFTTSQGPARCLRIVHRGETAAGKDAADGGGAWS
jgi:hypothetical protein